MKTFIRILYVLPIIGAIVGGCIVMQHPEFRMEKAVLAVAMTVIPFCAVRALKELVGE